jgi:hypothetical protein
MDEINPKNNRKHQNYNCKPEGIPLQHISSVIKQLRHAWWRRAEFCIEGRKPVSPEVEVREVEGTGVVDGSFQAKCLSFPLEELPRLYISTREQEIHGF